MKGLEVLDLKAVREVEDKKLKLQEAQANEIAQENDFENSKNLALNVALERLEVETSYMDKISKAQSELFTAQSNFYNAKEKRQ